jgi:hypothetical protein
MAMNPLVDEEVAKTRFACDLGRCKGACCTMPGHRGAPLLEAELEEIEKALPVVRKYLSFQHKDTIDERGWMQGRRGDYTTQVVDRKACVFVVFENGIATCAFEKAFLNREIQWRKPVSCHLFPIRVRQEPSHALRFEFIAECQPAVERGQQENIPLWKFLETALVRAYGEEWYREFASYCSSHT